MLTYRKYVIIHCAEVIKMTDKLYCTDGETRTFTAQVLSCTEENGACSVALDRTALFPGGGGLGFARRFLD